MLWCAAARRNTPMVVCVQVRAQRVYISAQVSVTHVMAQILEHRKTSTSQMSLLYLSANIQLLAEDEERQTGPLNRVCTRHAQPQQEDHTSEPLSSPFGCWTCWRCWRRGASRSGLAFERSIQLPGRASKCAPHPSPKP